MKSAVLSGIHAYNVFEIACERLDAFVAAPIPGTACENSRMNLQKIIVPVLGVVGVVLAYRFYGWAGVAATATAIVMWVLLHFTRMMTILKRAANRPIGYVDSAVMLNAKLKPGMTLLHVVAMTRALGALQSAKDAQPEIYRWSDGGESQVTATFAGGKLVHHELFRPTEDGLSSSTP